MRGINLRVILVILFCFHQSFSASNANLKDLYESKQYFDLRDRLLALENDKSNQIVFYRGAIANKFNSPEVSISLLNLYLKNARANDQHLKECYSLLADNYTKTFRYSKAAEMYRILLSKFSKKNDEKEKAGYENVLKLWNALAGVRPQRVWFKGDSRLQGTKEEVGLTVPVGINGNQPENLIFDTGANLSTITESLARKLNLKIIEVRTEVGSITGDKVKARLGVAEKVRLGSVTAENVVFLIFPDKALYVEPIAHQINGLIGFPLITALREITWTKRSEIFIPTKPSSLTVRNLALHNLTPLVAGDYQGKRLIFVLDTGASNSNFYQPFLKLFENDLTRLGAPTTESMSGIGGSKATKSYLLRDLKMSFAGKEATFPEIKIFTEKTTGLSQYVFGNIGRDLIDQFDRMTINFQTMSMVFE